LPALRRPVDAATYLTAGLSALPGLRRRPSPGTLRPQHRSNARRSAGRRALRPPL